MNVVGWNAKLKTSQLWEKSRMNFKIISSFFLTQLDILAFFLLYCMIWLNLSFRDMFMSFSAQFHYFKVDIRSWKEEVVPSKLLTEGYSYRFRTLHQGDNWAWYMSLSKVKRVKLIAASVSDFFQLLNWINW